MFSLWLGLGLLVSGLVAYVAEKLLNAQLPTHVTLHIELPPPQKRRRTFTGSIISTAVSAALIGTAVGLTVYRLYVVIDPCSRARR
jgi:hypothetical protein